MLMWYVILLWVTSQKILDFSEIFCWCFFWSTMVGLGSESSFRIHQHLQEWDVFVQKNLLPALSLSDSILSFRSAVIMCIGEYRTSRDLHFIGRVNKILWHQDLCFAKVWVFSFFPFEDVFVALEKGLGNSQIRLHAMGSMERDTNL